MNVIRECDKRMWWENETEENATGVCDGRISQENVTRECDKKM